MVRPSWLKVPVLWWWRSLPLRVVLTVFVASVLVQVLGGFLLMQQATVGVVNSKSENAEGEARRVISAAQQQLDGVAQTGGVNVDEVLSDLAAGFAYREGGSEPYEVIIQARGRTITTGRATADSIPPDLEAAVQQGPDLLITRTQVVYAEPDSNLTQTVPGLVAGSTLNLPGTERYQMYLVFPLTQEVETLDLLRYAVITTGIILVILLTFIAALVSRQVVTPVRAAARTAESIASGNLADRMPIRGQDDLAKLAKSMNYMASELEKQITTLEELSAVQQRFVSDVSHELRTPLTTVRMAAEVLYEAREEFDPVSARSAELMQTELDRFEGLLTDLLEISRFDAGAAVLSADVVDLRDIVASVVDAHALLARSHGVTITVHAVTEAKAEVDARRIERILRNLVVNAIEHSEGRPIEILVASDQLAVAVAVRDHGVGFEASQAKQVFHRFWRADPARARMVGGSGLGLAIAMEDANLHGGWLTAWGRPGLGAQFRLTLARRLGMVLRTSPLPLVPRDLVAAGVPAIEPGTTDPEEPAAPVEPVERVEEDDERSEESGGRERPGVAVTPARVRAVLLSALLGLVTLTGCISIPTTGPIKTVPGDAEVCRSCVNVEVAPPAPGADARQVVEGYLLANSNYQPNYAVARQFLTAQAADSWRPEAGARIYSSEAAAGSQSTARREFKVTGSLAADRTYTAENYPVEHDFGLVRENGEWRIGRPPSGLLVQKSAFERSFSGYSRFFVGNGLTLVPERVYLPVLRNPPNVAAALMRALLDGPSDWLRPAAISAIPEGTTLVGDSVTLPGIAQVALSEDVLALDPPARSQLGAQVLYTLQQVSGVQGVRITVNQQKFRVPEADPNTGVLATDAFSVSLEPEPLVSDQSYALRAGRVHAVRTPNDAPTLEPVMGPLGEKGAEADSLAVAVNGSDIAVVTDDRTTLSRASIGTGEVRPLRSGMKDMLRPQFTRYGEVWTVARRQGRQQLLMFDGERSVPVNATALNGRRVTAFRISPDGARIALVWRTELGESELGLARIVRSGQLKVDALRLLDVQQPGSTPVVRIADVAWLDATALVLMGAAEQDGPYDPVRVVADASRVVAEAGESGWSAEKLTVLPREQSVVVVGRNGESWWRVEGRQWLPYLEDVEAVAYAG